MAGLAIAVAAPQVAQLLAPSPQPGPVRLPATPLEPGAPRGTSPRPALRQLPAPASEPPPSPPASLRQEAPGPPAPRVEGWDRYAAAELASMLEPCLRAGGAEQHPADAQARLERCAALLTSRMVADGYLNSRAYPLLEPQPGGTLVVVEGRIVEVRVRGANSQIRRRLRRLALPLQGQVLHLASLERALAQLERRLAAGPLIANLNRLGGDSGKAVLELQVDGPTRSVAGEMSLRNDGSAGSGQFRGLAAVASTGVAHEADQLLVVGELNSSAERELGYRALSLSYRLPFAERWGLTSAAAASWRQLVETPPPYDALNFQQAQALAQLDVVVHDGPRQRLGVFAGLSANRASSRLAGERFAGILGGGGAGVLSSGFVEAGLSWEATVAEWGLASRLYGLQGLAGVSGASALRELAFFGVRVGQARALGADLNAAWSLAPGWQLQLRGAGQHAFQPLTNAMGFSLGSDNGLRGLPGQVVSGDSGALASGELSWLFWRGGEQQLRLVPFLGAGWVRSSARGVSWSGSLGAGGVVVRWLRGRQWSLELGWASQFGDALPADASHLLIDSGLYTKLSYRF